MAFGNPKCGITPEQLGIIANIVKNSVTSYRERKIAANKFYIALVEAQIRDGRKPSQSTIDELNKRKGEVNAETGSHRER